ncbi:MAG: putative Zn-dependent protease [Gammaproteobacteria bacterium]|nr:putative Zn-dependent protease [Gammaproteobacteria bacterium]
MRQLIYIILVITLLASFGCAVNPVTGQQDLVLMSEQDEIALGRKSHQQVLQQYGVYDDPELQSYVQKVGERLAANSHRNNLIYRFTVLDSKEVNAFALPGGYIYITRGLMSYLNSEAELAAVVGHEIGHVTARHSVRQYSAAQLANIGATLGAILIPGMNSAGNQLVQIFGTALLRGYGREHELEADQLGAEYLARTDYNPQAMLDVIRVLKNQELFETQAARAEGREPNIYHGLFSTHPDSDARLQEVIAHADKYRNTPSNFIGREIYMDKMNGLVFGDSPEQGIVRGRNFYHEKLGFAMQMPHGWNIMNHPDRLAISAPNGVALMQLGMEDINERISPREFMETRLGLQHLTNDAPLNIHGSDAHTGLAPVNTSDGKRTWRFTVIYFNNQAYILVGVAKDPGGTAEFDSYFLETAQSFHAITSNERILAKPLRLKTIEVGSDTTFAALAQSSPLETYSEEKLRLLNGMFPNGEPQAGMLLKVVE